MQAACLEVVLNHAGHDYNEPARAMRADKISEAERLAAEGATRIAGCPAEPAAVAAATAPATDAPADADRDGVPDERATSAPTRRRRVPSTRTAAPTTTRSACPASCSRPTSRGCSRVLPRARWRRSDAHAPPRPLDRGRRPHRFRAPDAHNLALSQRRAETVRRYLIERGVKECPLIARGYGETAPVADNASDAASPNRRVVLRILR